MSEYDFDVMIIGGGGSGGFTAATTAMGRGAKVGMAESYRLGGLCILAGCMPSKTLLHCADELRSSGRSGIEAYSGVLARKRQVVEHLAGKRVQAVEAKRAKGLEVIEGRATLKDEHTVDVNGRDITFNSLVVASGSTEIVIPFPGLEETGYIFTGGLMDLEALPASLTVIGGGVMALEMAQYASRMGVTVTIVQRSGHLLSKEPAEVGKLIRELFEAEGIKVYTGTGDLEFAKSGHHKKVSFTHQGERREVLSEEILMALGRRPATDGLGLEQAGVELVKGAVKVDKAMRSTRANIYAAGDVTGINMVVNLAILQGETAGVNASGGQALIDDSILPQAAFTDPQYAKVGLSRAQCLEQGMDFAEASWDLADLGVARTYAKPLAGFMSMRADKSTGRIVGAEIVAPEASLLIHDTAVAMKLGGAPADLASLPYVHPCLSELTNLCAHRLARMMSR